MLAGQAGLHQRKAAADEEPVQKSSSTFVENIKKLDVLSNKTEDDFVEKTNLGGLVSVTALILMLSLIGYELSWYLGGETVDRLTVDLSSHKQLTINMDITFHSLPCTEVNIDVMDVMGDPLLRMQSHVYKSRLGKDGEEIDNKFESKSEKDRERELLRTKEDSKCGDCHVPASEGRCCNTCGEVFQAMVEQAWDNARELADATEQCVREVELLRRIQNENSEGCRVYGYIEVNKVAGNFHFAPGKTFVTRHGHHIHEFKPEQAARFNVSHTINSLWFGEVPVPTVQNALDGQRRISESGPAVFQYFLKIIPTTYLPRSGEAIQSYQYAVTEHKKQSGQRSFVLPGIFFIYDLSPIRVTVSTEHTTLLAFLTRLVAVVGGIFTVSGMTDSFIHGSVKRFSARRHRTTSKVSSKALAE